ncbi:MAG: peptidyl-prolyl cis-trans isomerase [Defluviitaleaceae bacterium]|nr:peptidyl-prolyl cis-trans isomerase [Defluviitaleaceae bacterium]
MSKRLSGKSLNVKKDNESKKHATPAIDPVMKKRVLIGGAIGLVVIIALTWGLIMYYGDSVVARVNGINIMGADVQPQLGTANQRLQHHVEPITDWERAVREEAVRIAALNKLYEDYGRGLGLSFGANDSPALITNTVTNAIVDDPSLFADFERFMPEDLTIDAYARALEIVERLRAGEDFDTLMAIYGEDPGMVQNPEGYNFLAHQMVPEFTEGTLALEIGEIGDPVQSDFGFHIIMRIEPDPDNIMQGAVPAEGEEVLGAKHILVAATRTAEADRMAQAVHAGFQQQLEDANITFRGALNRVEI